MLPALQSGHRYLNSRQQTWSLLFVDKYKWICEVVCFCVSLEFVSVEILIKYFGCLAILPSFYLPSWSSVHAAFFPAVAQQLQATGILFISILFTTLPTIHQHTTHCILFIKILFTTYTHHNIATTLLTKYHNRNSVDLFYNWKVALQSFQLCKFAIRGDIIDNA